MDSEAKKRLLPIRIIHTIAGIDPRGGGPSRSIAEMAVAEAQLGIVVSVWTPKPQREEWTSPLTSAGVQFHSGDLGHLFNRVPGRDTIIHDHGLWLPCNHIAARCAGKHRVARIVSPRGMLEPWALNHRKWRKKLAWALYQRRDLERAAALHATAMAEAENLRRLGLRAPIFVIPNGISPPPSDYRTWKRHPDGDPPKRRAVFLSRIHPKKGLPMLAEAWSRVRPKGWRMSVVGPDEGGHRAEVMALTKHLGIDANWDFHDQALGDEKWRRLAEAELMILPTHSENFGNVVPEALLVETPVITTTGAPWKDLETHRCGWWASPTVEGITTALRSACSKSSGELRELGARGREWALREFAAPSLARQMVEAYEWVIKDWCDGQ